MLRANAPAGPREGAARVTWPTTCPELGGALNLWARRGAQIPSNPLSPQPLVGRRRRATVNLGP